ncbi:glutathione S-transferase [Thiohalorhabdus methylotrophus]|uniref:Glutathione S-transferase n=1 Tax=Thiohalorhabdus methylotrophus TaxID=3242694 RepID=A0ABV4U2H4_9GAMM
MTYRLYYWPTIQGRGELVRLALEAVGAEYEDVGRTPEGPNFGAVSSILWGEQPGPPAFAPPVLDVDGHLIAQTANILLYLGGKHGLAPEGELDRLWVNQLQLTIADFVGEIHDTHHPVGVQLYYEDQKEEALNKAQGFREYRLPKFLGYFERVLADNADAGWLAGTACTYADLSMFQVVAGLRYAFPNAMARAEYSTPRVTLLHQRVRDLPRISAYLDSERRIPFNEDGIFRHYPELDE